VPAASGMAMATGVASREMRTNAKLADVFVSKIELALAPVSGIVPGVLDPTPDVNDTPWPTVAPANGENGCGEDIGGSQIDLELVLERLTIRGRRLTIRRPPQAARAHPTVFAALPSSSRCGGCAARPGRCAAHPDIPPQREMAGWDVARLSAAFAMLPLSTTDIRTRRSCSLTRRSMR
jgi:hypothetical protein